MFFLQELRMMARIEIEVGLQELESKFGYRNRDRSLVTGIGIKLGYRNWDRNWVTGIGIEVGDEVGQIEVEIEL